MDKIILIPKQEDEADEEWGILYPDGTIAWEYHNLQGYRLGDLRSQKERREIQKRYNDDAIERHTSGGKLQFVKRTVTTSYGVPVIAKAEYLDQPPTS